MPITLVDPDRRCSRSSASARRRSGACSGPVMALWFAILAVAGLAKVIDSPAILRALSPTLRRRILRRPRRRRVPRARLGRAGGDRRRGAVRRHGPLRPAADPPRLVLLVFPALTLNYLGQGALILDSPAAIDNPFFLLLPHWARDPDGAAGDRCDGDRVAGGDLRGVLGHPPGRAARLPAAAADPAHVRGRGPDLRAGRQRAAVRRRRRARGRLRLVGRAGVRLRHRGDRHARDRHDPVLRRRARRCGTSRCGWRSRGRRAFLVVDLAFFSANLPKVVARRLVSAAARADRLHDAARPGSAAGRSSRPSAPRRRGCCATSSRRCARWTRPSTARPGPPCS